MKVTRTDRRMELAPGASAAPVPGQSDFEIGSTATASFFDGTQPLDVDLGCGDGAFLLARARRYPRRRILGIDLNPRRVLRVRQRIAEVGVKNADARCADARELMRRAIPATAVSAYYVLFPDPWRKETHPERRLLNEEVISDIARTLTAGGLLYFLTDYPPYLADVTAWLRRDHRFTEAVPERPAETHCSAFAGRYRASGGACLREALFRRGRTVEPRFQEAGRANRSRGRSSGK